PVRRRRGRVRLRARPDHRRRAGHHRSADRPSRADRPLSKGAPAAGWLGRLTGLPVRDARVVGSQHGYQHLMVTLSGGRRAFAKAVVSGPLDGEENDGVAAAFAAEAKGLRWLAEADAVPVPEVLAVTPSALV